MYLTRRHIWFAWNCLKYFLCSRHRYGYGVHSHFVYEMITEVFNDRKEYPEYKKIEEIRNKRAGDRGLIHMSGYGAGSVTGKKIMEVGCLVRQTGIGRKYGRLLFRLVRYLQTAEIIELGTSAGISTMYLALGAPEARLVTVEGSPELADLAGKNLSETGRAGVEVRTGLFEKVLPCILQETKSCDFVFIDGDHRGESLLEYFCACMERSTDKTVMVFDDICWSRSMTRAWRTITRHDRVSLSIDLFRMGVIFLHPGLSKQQMRIRF